MNIAITGHTRGIGCAISALFKNDTVLGLSRSTGYDIRNTESIIDSVKDCDIFINNAYDGGCQTAILSALAAVWKNTDKLIITIGSTVTDYPRSEIHLDKEPFPYRDYKRELRDTFRVLSRLPNSCRMSLVSPGATDTDMIKHLTTVKMDPLTVAKTVQYVIDNPFIKEITIYEK